MLRGRTFILTAGLALAAALAIVQSVEAADVGIAARQLVVVDKLAFSNRAAVRFVAIDAGIRKGSGTNAATIGATIDLNIVAPEQPAISGAFDVPDGYSTTAGWRVNNASVAKYVNPGAPGGPTQVRVLAIQQNHLIKLSAKGLGDLPINLGDLVYGPFDVQVRVVVVNDVEVNTHCTVFHSTDCQLPVIAAGTGRKLQCRNGQPVPDCAFPAAP